MCAVDDCPPWDVYNETEPTAARDHRCTECGRCIRRGEQYRRVQGCCDGAWWTHKICVHCDAASAWMTVVCGGWVFDNLYTELLDHWRDGYRSAGLFRLIVGVRRGWHDGRTPVPTGVSELARGMLARWPEWVSAA